MFPTLALVAALTAAPPPKAVAITPEVAAKLQEIAFQAAREGDVETLRAYFAAGRPVNDANKRGDTLLIVAAYNGQPKAVAAVLDQKAVAVDARNKMGLTALAAAAFKGEVEIAKALVKAKADVNAAGTDDGRTALMFAALAGREKVVEYLLSVGADPAAADKAGNTPLSLAKTQGAEGVRKLLEAAKK